MLPVFVKDNKGNIYLNELVRYVKGTIIVPASSQIPVVSPAAASAAVPGFSPPVIVEGSEDGFSEIYSFMGEHGAADNSDVTNRLAVQITDNAWRRRLMNRDVLADHVFGNNLQPLFVPESIFLEGQQTMTFQFTNNSTAGSSNFRFALEARKFQATALSNSKVIEFLRDMRQRKAQLYPFWQTSDSAVSIPAGGTVDSFFTIDRTHTVLVLTAMGRALTTGVAGDTQEKALVELFDPETDRPLQNQPVAFNCAAGTSRFPYVFPTGWLCPPNTKIHARFTNLITDQATEIFFTFHGVGCFGGEIPLAASQPVAVGTSVGAP